MEKDIKFDSDYIFPKTSFWSGVASIMGVAGNFYDFKYSQDPDNNAIRSDFKVIGKDIKKSQKRVQPDVNTKFCIK